MYYNAQIPGKCVRELNIRAKFQYQQWEKAGESTPISSPQALNFNKVYFYLNEQHVIILILNFSPKWCENKYSYLLILVL